MKKVKFMLVAVTIVAAVGGALAFKAKIPNSYYCTTAANQSCTVLDDYLITIDEQGSVDSFCSTTSHTGQAGDVCPAVKVRRFTE